MFPLLAMSNHLSTAKSPVFSHISATFSGLSTIRAFRAQDLLQDEFEHHQDLNTGARYMLLGRPSTFFVISLYFIRLI